MEVFITKSTLFMFTRMGYGTFFWPVHNDVFCLGVVFFYRRRKDCVLRIWIPYLVFQEAITPFPSNNPTRKGRALVVRKNNDCIELYSVVHTLLITCYKSPFRYKTELETQRHSMLNHLSLLAATTSDFPHVHFEVSCRQILNLLSRSLSPSWRNSERYHLNHNRGRIVYKLYDHLISMLVASY